MKIHSDLPWYCVKGYLDEEMKRHLALKDRPKKKD